VIWTGPPVADGDAPVLVPAPGAHGVPRTGTPEWPAPDRAPDVYADRVGYPVSVTFEPLPYVDVDLTLLRSDGATEEPGLLFTPERPISKDFPRNGGAAYYLPREPLTRGERYWAVFRARRDGKDVRIVWTFFVD